MESMCLWRFWVGPGYCSGGEACSGMAHLYHLILGVLLALCCGHASATLPASVRYCSPGNTVCGTESQVVAFFQASTPTRGCGGDVTMPYTWYSRNVTSSGFDLWAKAPGCPGYGPYDAPQFGVGAAGSICPDHSLFNGVSCSCDTGYLESGGKCVNANPGNSCDGLSDFCSGLKGEKINLEGKGTATPPGCSADSQRPNCPMGCAGEAVGMGVSYKTSDGSWMTGQEYRVTGGTCTLPQPSDVPQKKESDCAGSVGEINGVRTCVPNQAATGDTTSKETKNGDGTSSNTESKTTCENGVCKTTNTTTTKDASGNTTSTSTSSSTISQREYCATNKASTVCAATNGSKNPDSKDGTSKDAAECSGDDCKETPSKFTGSCEAGFSCEGDALQCAIAQDQHRRSCQLFDSPSDESRLYNAEKGKAGNQAKDLPGNESIDLSSNRIDMTSAIGGGSCMSDLQISLAGQSATLPLSDLCKWHEYMGNILVAVALLGALRIIAGS